MTPRDPAAKRQQFKRIFEMGMERVLALNNMLARGTGAHTVAKIVQDDWGLFRDIQHKALSNQIGRYWAAMQERAIDPAQEGAQTVGLVTHAYEPGVRIDVLRKLHELSELQLDRVRKLVTKEQNMPMPVAAVTNAINKEVETLKTMYRDIQTVQFDLGVDEFRGPVVQGGKMVQTLTQNPDGSTTETRSVEAYQLAMDVMNRLPPPEGAQSIAEDVAPR